MPAERAAGSVVIGTGSLLFGVPIFGSLWLLAFLSTLFIATNLAVGYTFSTIAQTQLQATGGKYRAYDEPSLTRTAAERAYRMAGIGPSEIDVAEVRDATSFCEIYQCEMLRLDSDEKHPGIDHD